MMRAESLVPWHWGRRQRRGPAAWWRRSLARIAVAFRATNRACDRAGTVLDVIAVGLTICARQSLSYRRWRAQRERRRARDQR